MTYYQLLGIEEGASEAEIKQAFRKLAKQWHPDRNPSPDARTRFVAVMEAYEVLSSAPSRSRYDLKLRASRNKEAFYQRKEAEYHEWFERYQQSARQRANHYAEDAYDDFVNSPVYRTAMAVSKVYNYIFLAIGIFMVAGPFLLWYVREYGYPEARPWYAMFWPASFGLAFTYGIYYFLFKTADDD